MMSETMTETGDEMDELLSLLNDAPDYLFVPPVVPDAIFGEILKYKRAVKRMRGVATRTTAECERVIAEKKASISKKKRSIRDQRRQCDELAEANASADKRIHALEHQIHEIEHELATMRTEEVEITAAAQQQRYISLMHKQASLSAQLLAANRGIHVGRS